MKYFGQYLVEKNLISIEILLDALLEQICSLPPICQVVRTKNLLPVNQVLKALELQSKKEIEFSQACRELGIWTQDLSTSIKNEVQKAKIPLGQILVEKGALSLSDLTHALDEFLSKDDNLLPSHPLAKSSADPSQKTSPYEFKNIRENMLGEVQSFFCHKTLNEIKLLYSSLPNSEHVIQTATALLKEVHTLKGFTVYLNLTIIVKLIHHMERQLTFLLRSPSLNSSNLVHISQFGLEITSLIEDICPHILQDKTEKSYYEKHQDKIEQLFHNLSQCEKEFQGSLPDV